MLISKPCANQEDQEAHKQDKTWKQKNSQMSGYIGRSFSFPGFWRSCAAPIRNWSAFIVIKAGDSDGVYMCLFIVIV